MTKTSLFPAAVLLLAACAAAPEQPAASAPAGAAVPADKLAGSWKLVKIGSTELPADARAVLEFDTARAAFSGSAGCNNLFGGYTADSNSLKFGETASTRMLCEPPLMERERNLTDTLQRTEAYAVENDTLTLYSAARWHRPSAARAKTRRHSIVSQNKKIQGSEPQTVHTYGKAG